DAVVAATDFSALSLHDALPISCAPATLAAVSAFLGAPIDHLTLASVITYEGTPDHEERHWLENHGWSVREFRVTWDVAVALLTRERKSTRLKCSHDQISYAVFS